MPVKTPSPKELSISQPPNSGYLQPKYAAEFLGTSKSTLNKWRMKGTGPNYKKLGAKLVVYKMEDLQQFADARDHLSTCEYNNNQNQ